MALAIFLAPKTLLLSRMSQLAEEEAVKAYISALAAFHHLPDVVVKEIMMSGQGIVLDEKGEFFQIAKILVIKNITKKSDDSLEVMSHTTTLKMPN